MFRDTFKYNVTESAFTPLVRPLYTRPKPAFSLGFILSSNPLGKTHVPLCTPFCSPSASPRCRAKATWRTHLRSLSPTSHLVHQ